MSTSASAGISVWDVLAAIGAASGIPALLWQVFTWFRSGPTIRVTAANAFPIYGNQMRQHHFSITAVNVGRTATTVSGWGLRAPDGSDMVVTNPIPFSTQLPTIVRPHESATFYVEAEGVLDLCKRKTIRARQMHPWVRLATGRVVFVRKKSFFKKGLPWKE